MSDLCSMSVRVCADQIKLFCKSSRLCEPDFFTLDGEAVPTPRSKRSTTEVMMTLHKLLDIVDAAYGDGAVAHSEKTGDDGGDTLALFVVRELRDTFDEKECDARQLEDAACAMELAKSDIERVIASLDRAADAARRKEAQKQKG